MLDIDESFVFARRPLCLALRAGIVVAVFDDAVCVKVWDVANDGDEDDNDDVSSN